MTRTLCLIPARGGSQGIPRKNLADVAGRPLIAWTIEQALAVTDPGLEVFVSTEDAEIAEVAASYGAGIVVRPASLAEDTTATEPVVRHAIAARTEAGAEPDRVLLLQATSPVRHPGTLDRALAELGDADSLVGVVPQAPFLWRATDPPVADYDVGHRPRRQDLTPATLRYRETGSLYLTRTEIYRTRDNRLGGRIRLFVMDEDEGIDVDTPLDLELAARRLQTP